MTYIILRGNLYDIIGLNIRAPVENKTNDTKTAFTRNWSVSSINYRSIVWKFSQEISMQL